MGLEFVRQYTDRGHRVIALARSSTAELEKRAAFVQLDLESDDSIDSAAQSVRGLTDQVDVLINNAGIAHGGVWEQSENLGTLTRDAMDRVIRVNTLGPLLFTQALLPELKRPERSVIAGVSSYFSSLSGRSDFFANNFGYSMSKVSLNMWLRSLSILLANDGVLTVALDPGWVRTDMGGPDGFLSAQEAVAGMIRVIDGLSPEQSGTYLAHDGNSVPW